MRRPRVQRADVGMQTVAQIKSTLASQSGGGRALSLIGQSSVECRAPHGSEAGESESLLTAPTHTPDTNRTAARSPHKAHGPIIGIAAGDSLWRPGRGRPYQSNVDARSGAQSVNVVGRLSRQRRYSLADTNQEGKHAAEEPTRQATTANSGARARKEARGAGRTGQLALLLFPSAAVRRKVTAPACAAPPAKAWPPGKRGSPARRAACPRGCRRTDLPSCFASPRDFIRIQCNREP